MANDMTLDEARDWLRARVDDGAPCPCCTQFAKVYRRKLTSTTARILISLYLDGGDEDGWAYVPGLIGKDQGGDVLKARYWGLIEPLPDVTRDDGSHRNGWWRLTEVGSQYVQGVRQIPKYARVYDGRCIGMDGDWVDIRDALGMKFNYRDLMAGV